MKTRLAFSLCFFTFNNVTTAQPQIDVPQLLYDVKALSADSMQGRKTCTVGNKQAQAYIVAAFQKNHLQAFNESFRQFFAVSVKGDTCADAANLIGYIPGASSDCIVLSAHYDHLGVRDGQIFHGADDNASGVATLLAIMAYFNGDKPHSTIIFAVFDAEEVGLQGSRAFVSKLPVEKKRLVLNVNLDMVSRNERHELYAAGCHDYPFLKPYVEKIAKTSAVKLRFGHDRATASTENWTNASDHASFHQAGIPFIYFGVEDHCDYHQPTDIFANIDQTFFINAARTILDAVIEFDRHLTAIKSRTAGNPASGN